MEKVYDISEIRRALRPVFAEYPVYSATLFGSYAKGKATEQSDVDIVIDSRGQLLNMDFYGVLDKITERLGKSVDLFEISEIHNPSPIYADIQKEGVLLYDRQG
ncbi:MAG: nucleotidyltransferase domain-containing protein [Oscillospiraceae bacterium]|jgi:predicted nucleotidyltransferase|nr:nucleotidyltransferase domain-containing protein [Oscillospiraceae bacterium]